LASSSKRSKEKAQSGDRQRATATLRSTSGAGFEFEDLIAAWQLVKALSGEQVPGIGGVTAQLQTQVSTLGWRIDDLLLTSETIGGVRRLAISVKGNQQVSTSALPSSFVALAWEQWRDSQGPFDRSADALALVTLGTLPSFEATWREVKNACSGSDVALAMSRIRNNQKQSRVFNSVQEIGGNASDEETIELIRRLHVLPVDLQFEHSKTLSQSITQCRGLLESGDMSEAEALWHELLTVAADVRLRKGTITVPDLWSRLRVLFGLRQHPDFQRDWESLYNVTSDHKLRIETELPSGYAVPRTAEKASFRSAVAANEVTVVFGESGCGKSAMVKSVLDVEFNSWTQVWFGPEELKTALSATHRGTLPLRHELSRVLNATATPSNVLVIDSAERIVATEFIVIRQLLQAILPAAAPSEAAWHVVVVTQTQGWAEGPRTILDGRNAKLFELEQVTSGEVKLALLLSPMLGWLVGHDDTIEALTNLRTLGWVINAGAALESNASGLVSHTAIAERLWKYWTQDRNDIQALMMRLARREASFERSFALTDLDPAEAASFTQRPSELPLRLNERTNRVEFEHDLAADWARFQFLKQVWADTMQWTTLAENPLWTNALRMLGQFLLRQTTEDGTAWDMAFDAAVAAKNELAGDILLDALCLDPEAEGFLTDRLELLLANNANVFNRLLLRFHHIATVPTGGRQALTSALGLYLEAQYRSVVIGRWPPLLRFLIAQRERLRGLILPALAKVIETWLAKTPRELSNGALMPFRQEMAEIALAMARTVQVEKDRGVMYLMQDHLLYTAPLAGAADLPEEVGNWALEMAGRRKVDKDVERRTADARREQALVHTKRLETDSDYEVPHVQLRRLPPSISSFRERLPPWPLGASSKVDRGFPTSVPQGDWHPVVDACETGIGGGNPARALHRGPARTRTEIRPPRDRSRPRLPRRLLPNRLLEEPFLSIPGSRPRCRPRCAHCTRELLDGKMDHQGHGGPRGYATMRDAAVRRRGGEDLPGLVAGVRLASV
jgi:ABC-type oligopeptide transport system ATPase subunit